MAQLLERWNAMSEAERVAATEEQVKEMASDREMKETSPKTSPLALVQDVRRTLALIEKEVRGVLEWTVQSPMRLCCLQQLANLHQRTGVEVAMISVRSSHKSTLKPHTFSTSDKLPAFWDETFDISLHDIAVLMEAHFLAKTKICKIEGMLLNNPDLQ